MAKPSFQQLSSLKWYPLKDRIANVMAIVYSDTVNLLALLSDVR